MEQKWDRLAPNRVLSDRLLELQLVDGRLYLVRPASGEQLLSPAEAQVARRAAEARAAQEAIARQAAEVRAAQEAVARQAAEARAARAEAEQQRLQAELQRLQRET